MVEAADGTPVARASDHVRLCRQLKSLGFMVKDLERRLVSVEIACADVREDLCVARQIDQQLAEAVEQLLDDVTRGR